MAEVKCPKCDHAAGRLRHGLGLMPQYWCGYCLKAFTPKKVKVKRKGGKVTISKKLREAMKQYFRNRKNQKEVKWDKQADLQGITDALPKNCTNAQYTAGTFWLTWKSPRIQTTHSEKNYWCGKILALWDRKGKEWVKVSDMWA